MSRLTIAVIPLYKRYKLSTWCLGKAKVLPGIDHIIAVGSVPGDREAAWRAGVEYHQFENMPLGLKWQHCFDLALGLGADGVLMLGSDDVYPADLVPRLWGELDKGVVLAGSASWYLVMLNTGDVYFQRYKTRIDSIGTGRLYDARFIGDKLGGKLYHVDALQWAMDNYATKRILAAGGKQVAIEGVSPAMCKLRMGKSEEQITSAEVVLGSETIISHRMWCKFTDDILTGWKEFNRPGEGEKE